MIVRIFALFNVIVTTQLLYVHGVFRVVVSRQSKPGVQFRRRAFISLSLSLFRGIHGQTEDSGNLSSFSQLLSSNLFSNMKIEQAQEHFPIKNIVYNREKFILFGNETHKKNRVLLFHYGIFSMLCIRHLEGSSSRGKK